MNLLDLDPYGESWPVIDAFLRSEREFPPRLVIVANDGLRKSLKMAGGWHSKSLTDVCAKYGNAYLYQHYLAVAQEMLSEMAAPLGYKMTRWTGYYCGHMGTMSHYCGVFDRGGPHAPVAAKENLQ